MKELQKIALILQSSTDIKADTLLSSNSSHITQFIATEIDIIFDHVFLSSAVNQ